MGKGFDTFMENEYWKGVYDSSPSEDLKEYYRIMFDESPFLKESDGEDIEQEAEELTRKLEQN